MSEATLRLIDCNGYTPDGADVLESLRTAVTMLEATLSLFRTEVDKLAEVTR